MPCRQAALALGSAVHQALAVYHRSLQQGEPVDREAGQARAWQERKNYRLIVFPHGDEPDTIAQGIALLDLYLQQPPPPNIRAMEQELRTPLVNSQGEVLEKFLFAVIDLVHRNEDDDLTVVDLKTSSRGYSDLEARLSLQATAYLYAAQEHYQEPVTFAYRVLVKTQKPRIQHIATARMPTDFDRLGDLVEAIDRAAHGGHPLPDRIAAELLRLRVP